ncbi:MAG TPA: cytochrome C oxidase subunit IV family protein [Acidobacteriaceae bacterium]|nr:cytochrome C oxidase subunit IV family protein [Acidobacteriaceae bacterium]
MSDHNQQGQDITSPKSYFLVYLALLAGVGLQIEAAFHNLGIFNPILLLAIAIGQATLVVLFSMHLKGSPKVNWISIGSALFILMILFGMVFMDCYSRAWGSW